MGKVLKFKSKKKLGYVKIFTIMLVMYFSYTFYTQQVQINKYNSQIEMFENDILAKEKNTKTYKEEVNSVNTDEYIEKVAREELGLVKPYEKIFIDVNK